MTDKGKHPFAYYLILTLLTVVACVVAGEVLLRAASLFLPGVRFLATAGVSQKSNVYDDLNQFLLDQKDLIPHRNWMNYHTNALGFADQEFSPANPDQRFRILTLGDSFCYAMVPYPQGVQTILDHDLAAACPEQRPEILNFGVPGNGLWEYATMFRLAAPVYHPRVVVLHLYLGNDTPNLLRHTSNLREPQPFYLHSYLWRFLANAYLLQQSLPAASHPVLMREAQKGAQAEARGSRAKRGGGKVNPGQPDPTDQSPGMVEPAFNREGYVHIMADEVGRFYNPGPEETARQYRPFLELLAHMAGEASREGLVLAVVLYPSRLQVYPAELRELVEDPQCRRENPGLDPARLDPGLPGRILAADCRRLGLPFLDLTPALRQAALANPAPLYKNRDIHWGVWGNQAAARAEAPFLRRLVCGPPPPRPVPAVPRHP
ncbi:MAG: hypothetical protein KQJ78_00190 [Deltaproteobacteria bacterium]|nr:hypothetical protein [Deltaproteobacteria bacterium]